MYFDDIYNSIIEDIEHLKINNDDDDDVHNNNNNNNNIEKTINTPMTKPIDIKNNIENEYIFVNKPNNKSVLRTIMDNSNEIIKKIKKMI